MEPFLQFPEQSNKQYVEDFLAYLKRVFPLHNRQVNVSTYDSEQLPSHLVMAGVVNATGLTEQFKSRSNIHVALKLETREVMNTVAHEYRHVMQYDEGGKVTDANRDSLEWDAYRFAAIEAHQYCRDNGINLV